MEIGKHDSGKPFIIFHKNGTRLMRKKGGGKLELSLTHTRKYAAAVAVLESKGESTSFYERELSWH